MSQIVPTGKISNIYPVGYTARIEVVPVVIDVSYNEAGYTYNDSTLAYNGSFRKQSIFTGSINQKNVVPSFKV